MMVVELDSLTVRYPGAARPALHDLSLRVGGGERVLLLGPSGCGKSTLLAVLLGLIPHSLHAEVSGVARVFGDSTATPAERAGRVAAVFQDPDSQICMLTVEDEVAFALENLAVPPQEMDARIDEALAQVGLGETSDRAVGRDSPTERSNARAAPATRRRRVDRLSGGEKQRLALAAALAMRPQLLLLDEPCSNLDAGGVSQLAAALRSLAARPAERTVIIVEHRLDAILDTLTRVIVLDRAGSLCFDGEPHRVFSDHARELETMGVWVPAAYRRKPGATVATSAAWRTGATPLSLQSEDAAVSRRRTEARHAAAAAARQFGENRPASPHGERAAAATRPHRADHPLLEMRGVGFEYTPGVPVLDGIDLEMHAAESLALLGPNGSGKTTLAKLACGLLRPTRGSVNVGGRPPHRIPARELPGMLGYVFQNPEHQFVRDTVRDEVAFTLKRQPIDDAERERRIAETLRRLSLTGFEDRNPFSLSHGQKRRLSAATMLVADAPLIAFDEPTFGQDWGHLLELEEMLAALSEDGVALLIITHDLALAERIADRTLHLPGADS